MGLLVWLTVLGFGTVYALAQRPHPCKSPPLLQGSLSVATQNEALQAVAEYSYDAIGQRIRFGEIGRYKNDSFYIDVLLLYKENVMYEINHHNSTCTKTVLKSSFHPLEIPNNASLLGQVVLGSFSFPGEGLLVNSWVGEIPWMQVKYLLTYTEIGCLPVTSLVNTANTGWIITNFFNNIVGIKDPTVFIPPSYCTNATLMKGDGKDFFSIF